MEAGYDVSKEVTMKDIYNLNRLLSLNISQFQRSKGLAEIQQTSGLRWDKKVAEEIAAGIQEASDMQTQC